MRRVTRIPVSDAEAMTSVITGLAPTSVVLDVQPIVLGWNPRPATSARQVEGVISSLLPAWPSVSHLLLMTNARLPIYVPARVGMVRTSTVANARKPWKVRPVRALPSPVVVVGDQVLTDGLLAWRLGLPFVHWLEFDAIPLWPMVQGVIGSALVRTIFVASEPRSADECT